MDVKYINPFLQGATNMLGQLGFSQVKRSGILKKEQMLVDLDITSVIGLVGDVRGNVALSLSEETALSLISKMMMGMPVAEVDEMGISAIAEFSNMLVGNAVSILADAGYKVDLTPPSVISGRNILFYISSVQTLAIIIESEAGHFELNIGLEM
jgi:chemotaxis protein CheX